MKPKSVARSFALVASTTLLAVCGTKQVSSDSGVGGEPSTGGTLAGQTTMPTGGRTTSGGQSGSMGSGGTIDSGGATTAAGTTHDAGTIRDASTSGSGGIVATGGTLGSGGTVDPVAGLGCTVFRYNIGGGDAPTHDHMGTNREMPGFESSSGAWDWNADVRQTSVLSQLVSTGKDVVIEAFSNSPPYWMTKSRCASGNTDGSNNLKDDSYDAFAA